MCPGHANISAKDVQNWEGKRVMGFFCFCLFFCLFVLLFVCLFVCLFVFVLLHFFGHADKFWKGHDRQIKKKTCKSAKLRVHFHLGIPVLFF